MLHRDTYGLRDLRGLAAHDLPTAQAIAGDLVSWIRAELAQIAR